MTTVLITGATGYLGSTLAQFLEARGVSVVRAVRDVTRVAAGRGLAFELGGRLPDAAELSALGITAAVHCAHDFSIVAWEPMRRTNVDGTLALARALATAGVERQVFVSTLSAYPGCVSRYGRCKLLTEEGMAQLGAVVVRPGLLYDANPRGLVGTMKRLAGRLPVIPVIGSGQQPQYTCHVQDLCACILRLVEDSSGTRLPLIVAAHPVSLPFREIVARLAVAAGRRRPRFLRVPWRLVWAGLRTLELVGVRVGLRSDSVLGLEFPARAPDFDGQRQAGVSFRAFAPEPSAGG